MAEIDQNTAEIGNHEYKDVLRHRKDDIKKRITRTKGITAYPYSKCYSLMKR